MCQLVKRHLWAIGKNISLHEGPPEEEEEQEEEDHDEVGELDSIKLTINKSE